MSKDPASRRDFLAQVARGGTAAALGGSLWIYLVREQTRAAPFVLRPPGALEESDFLSKCIKCGLCVVDCPYDTLRLAKVGAAYPIGTPYFIPREVPCYLCPDLPCVKACPTGALDQTLVDVEAARMGLAVLVDQENCLSYRGLRCEICYRECPLQNEAITIENRPRRMSRHALFVPIIHADACTGCGICEKVCPLPEATVKVLPPQLARGKPGDHYRFDDQGRGAEDMASPGQERVESDPDLGTELDYLNEGAP